MDPEVPTEARPPSLVRPYALTGGRTAAVVDVPIEATLDVLPSARQRSWPAAELSGRIVALCAEPQSVAEVSARLDLPLGVVRVLVADLVSAGHLLPRTTISAHTSPDERRALIERTLSGLRAL